MKWIKFRFPKGIFPLIILALADVVVMAIPFYMENFIPNIYENLQISASDYSQAGAIYGFFAMPCYLLGAYIGDKFKSKNLIILSLLIMGFLALWYSSLPFMSVAINNINVIKYQLYIIFAGFAIATCGLFWAPLWKLVKNHDTEKLVGEEKEKKVGQNNGIQGSSNGLIGLIIALVGILLLQLSTAKIMPSILIGGVSLNLGFIILVTLYTAFIFLSLFLVIFYIKEPKIEEGVSFSLKSLIDVAKKWRIWVLGLLILGVYMMQMGLGSYVNYLTNIFQIGPIIVMIIGVFRTYIMRFMISPFAGKKADKSGAYIFWICIGIIIGIVLITVAIILPGFSNDFRDRAITGTTPSMIIIQVAACLNLVLLGAITWGIVTIRWSPIGTELKIPNQQYAASVSLISVLAFTPDAFFKQIKSVIESKYFYEHDGIKYANQIGNQLILISVIVFALLGLVSGIILYFSIYRPKKIKITSSLFDINQANNNKTSLETNID